MPSLFDPNGGDELIKFLMMAQAGQGIGNAFSQIGQLRRGQPVQGGGGNVTSGLPALIQLQMLSAAQKEKQQDKQKKQAGLQSLYGQYHPAAGGTPWTNPDTGQSMTGGGLMDTLPLSPQQRQAVSAMGLMGEHDKAASFMGTALADQKPTATIQEFEYAKKNGFKGSFEDFKRLGSSAPSNIQEWEYYNRLPPDQKRDYLTMKRANPYLNLGDVYAQPDPTKPGTAMGQFGVGLEPGRKITDERVITTPAIPGQTRGGELRPGGAMEAFTGAAQVPGGLGITELPPTRKDVEAKEKRAQQQQRAGDIVVDDIDRALSKSGFWTTGMAGATLKDISGTGARDMQGLLKTIKANIGFDRLQQMREASPTGGALGQVAVQEINYLQSVYGDLEQSQSREQFEYNLNRLKNTYLEIIHHGLGNRPQSTAPSATGGWSIKRID